MKIFKIFKKDLKRIARNKVALGIIIGLCIIPSLYTWITLKANWNPYVDTGNVPIAVVNEDKGTIINNQIVNFGDQTVNQLQNNNSMKWTVVGKKVGDEGLKDGEYYAEIIIPSNFSEQLKTIYTGNPIKPDLIYRVNEKTNAIAAKISDLAVDQLQEQIKDTFFDSVNKVILTGSNNLGKNLKKNQPLIVNLKNVVANTNSNVANIINNINDSNNSVQDLSNYMGTLKNDIPNIENEINNLQGVVGASKYLIQSTQNNISNIQNNLNTINSSIQNTNNSLNSFINELKNTVATQKSINSSALSSSKDGLGIAKNDTSKVDKDGNKILDNANNIENDEKNLKLSNDQIEKDKNLLENAIGMNKKLSNLINSAATILETLNNISPNENISSLKNSLDNLTSIANKEINAMTDLDNYLSNENGADINVVNNKLDTIANLGNELTSGFSNFNNNYSNNISNAVNSLNNNLTESLNNIDGILTSSKAMLPQLKEIANMGITSSNLTVQKVNELQSKLSSLKGTLNNLEGKTNNLSNQSLDKIINLLEKNPTELSNLLASPVGMHVEELYGMSIFGVGLAPFYTVLSIWVGALLCTTILSVNDKEEEDGTKKSILSIHFGKMLLFLLINFVQATIVTVGDILILGIRPKEVWLLLLFAWFSGIVFTVIIFTFVSLNGNFGKATALVVMVIQVAGSGAIYPIEVNPEILQKIEFLWPFTYAIDGFRQAIGGADFTKVYHDAFALLIFLLIFVVLGILKVFTHPLATHVEELFDEGQL